MIGKIIDVTMIAFSATTFVLVILRILEIEGVI